MQRISLAAMATSLALVTVACGGLPEAPEWDVVVAAPFTTDRLSVEDFLPDEIGTEDVQGEPVFTLPSIREQASMQFSSLCPTCPAGSSSVVPAFSYGDNIPIDLLQDVVRMELRGAEAVVAATNELGFSLLGDTGDGTGFLEVVVFDQGTGSELGRERIEGPGSELLPGETLEIRIPLGQVDVTDGVRIEYAIGSPQQNLAQPVTISPSSSVAIEGGLQGLQVAAVTVRVDQARATRESEVQMILDEGAEQTIDDRLIGAEVEFELHHDLAIDGPFNVTIADSRSALFSGDPAHEITLGRFSFVPDQVQKSSLDAATVRRLIDFPEQWVGYEAIGTGTLNDPPGRGPLSRFTPDSGFNTRVRIATTFRVGG
jgi:hypothetical protein